MRPKRPERKEKPRSKPTYPHRARLLVNSLAAIPPWSGFSDAMGLWSQFLYCYLKAIIYRVALAVYLRENTVIRTIAIEIYNLTPGLPIRAVGPLL